MNWIHPLVRPWSNFAFTADFCQLVNSCILHTHSFLAACQVSHFEPAGVDGIFITSNPSVIRVGSHSRYEKCSGEVINLKSVVRLEINDIPSASEFVPH